MGSELDFMSSIAEEPAKPRKASQPPKKRVKLSKPSLPALKKKTPLKSLNKPKSILKPKGSLKPLKPRSGLSRKPLKQLNKLKGLKKNKLKPLRSLSKMRSLSRPKDKDALFKKKLNRIRSRSRSKMTERGRT